jgi:hypothetical protein
MPKVILLPRPDPNVHLSKQGYDIHKPATERHASLKRSSKKYGTLPVLKRLNLIRNITSTKTSAKTNKAHEIMSSDVEYMKKLYSHEKRVQSRQQSKKVSKKKSKKSSKKTKKN